MSEQSTPQLEDGFTRIANELMDALLGAGMTSRQWAVAMAVIRKTYGFNKKSDDIGLSQIASMTGIAKSHVSVAIRELEGRGILTRSVGRFGHVLGINKCHQEWSGVTKSVTPQTSQKARVPVTESVTGVTDSVTVTESVSSYRIGSERVTEPVTPPVTESVTTKDNHPKDNQKTEKHCAYQPPDWVPEEAWSAYLDMRKRIKKPMTEYAKRLAVGELEKFRSCGQDPEAVLNQSTMNSWQGLFEVKARSAKNGIDRHGNFAQQDYRAGVAADGSF
ncbi:replication protein [Cupriavidus respiraculi]|uniref:Bacteriophage lambda Replication protein O N-terminal domain-containing protein n=1 Tax=Cupriavidus respiraculi TaxID=195930 RepID=A0ABN7YG61_9BURK|nr:replication protein [Cupriavidus respiraculi]CAG9172453.1 hypothetical protein LMG21510_01979 [Cupriavidus respiraculi]